MKSTTANIIGLSTACVMLYIAFAVATQPAHKITRSASISHTKPQTLLQRQAKALREVYHLTDADIAGPVILWEEK